MKQRVDDRLTHVSHGRVVDSVEVALPRGGIEDGHHVDWGCSRFDPADVGKLWAPHQHELVAPDPLAAFEITVAGGLAGDPDLIKDAVKRAVGH